MTFLSALNEAQRHPAPEMRLSRPDGPSLIVDELGQIRVEKDCLYLGDILDFDDWEVAAA